MSSPQQKAATGDAQSVALSIPHAAEIIGQGDPAFATARRHYQASTAGVAVFLGATVAMGAELARLRKSHPELRGGDRRAKDNTVDLCSWKDTVKTHTGASYETCRRAEKVADDLLRNLHGKRGADSVLARKLLHSPDIAATYDDYAVLARVAGAIYDADTWTGILIEAGIIRRPIAAIAADTGHGEMQQLELPLFEQAKIAARGLLDRLRESVVHREQWLARLAALPIDAEDPDTPSLFELRTELDQRLVEIDQVIARKQSAS